VLLANSTTFSSADRVTFGKGISGVSSSSSASMSFTRLDISAVALLVETRSASEWASEGRRYTLDVDIFSAVVVLIDY